MPEPELYTLPEAAKILGRTEGAIRTAAHRGQIPITRVPGLKRIFVSRDDLQTLLRGQLVVDSTRPWDTSAKRGTRR